jgi:hypothetical protein
MSPEAEKLMAKIKAQGEGEGLMGDQVEWDAARELESLGLATITHEGSSAIVELK